MAFAEDAQEAVQAAGETLERVSSVTYDQSGAP